MDAASLLKNAAAKPVTKKKPPKSERWEIVLPLGSDLDKIATEACELAELFSLVDSPFKGAKNDAKDHFFDPWIQKYWADKARPESPNIFTLKEDGIKRDMKCQFQVKEKSDALAKVLPAVEEMPDDTTAEEFIIAHLVKIAGLKTGNAKIFVQDEVVIDEQIGLAESLSDMVHSESELKKSIASKLLLFFAARKKSDKFALFTDEEIEEYDGTLLRTEQTITLRSGYLERLCKYCTTIDQLRSLAAHLATRAIGQWDFSIGDSANVKAHRLGVIVGKYVTVAEAKTKKAKK